MPIRCHSIKLLVKAMEIELHLDTGNDRQLVEDRFIEWGYSVVSFKGSPAGIPWLITVLVTGSDRQGIIDKMCNDPEFDVKC
ncbi:MAG TPA: hypothetical protein VGP76_03375 [Planctomycetaceae bacterium]|jgi:hypothetical protein|nr:hypothetical protein [Planctomycetaceae bacterium]